jgi:trk system potassium uptake protein TrkH
LLLIQIGGLGFMTVAIIFVLMMGKKIGFRKRLILQEALKKQDMRES